MAHRKLCWQREHADASPAAAVEFVHIGAVFVRNEQAATVVGDADAFGIERSPKLPPAAASPARRRWRYGIKSKTASYRVLYMLTKPLLPWIRAAFPDHVLTTEQIGRAMLTVARQGNPKRVLESKDIRAVAHR
jgi:hypothetical protein